MPESSHRLCEVVQDWEEGETVTEEEMELRKCPNEAVGRYRYETQAGEVEGWLCEDHRDQFEEHIVGTLVRPPSERGDLIDPYEERGFWPIQSGLPGTWATNGEQTVALVPSRHVEDCHIALAYSVGAEDLSIDTKVAGEAISKDVEKAARAALEEAESVGGPVSSDGDEAPDYSEAREAMEESDRVYFCPECGGGQIRVTEDGTEIVACFGCDTDFTEGDDAE